MNDKLEKLEPNYCEEEKTESEKKDQSESIKEKIDGFEKSIKNEGDIYRDGKPYRKLIKAKIIDD